MHLFPVDKTACLARVPLNSEPNNLPHEDGTDPSLRADRETAARLVRALDPVAPPVTAWERIAREIDGSSLKIPPAGAANGNEGRRSASWKWGPLTAAAAFIGMVASIGALVLASRDRGPDPQVAVLRDKVSDYESRIAELKQEAPVRLAERDAVIATLKQGAADRIAEHEGVVASLKRDFAQRETKLLAERDERMAALEQEFADRDAQQADFIASLKRDFAQRDAELKIARADAAAMEAEVRSLESVLEAEQLQFAQLKPAEGTGTARARAFFDPAADRWRFRVTNLPAVAEGRVFQLWLVTADKQTLPSDTFQVSADGAARFAVQAPADVKPVAFAVSDEPPGGSQKPTGQVRLSGAIQSTAAQP